MPDKQYIAQEIANIGYKTRLGFILGIPVRIVTLQIGPTIVIQAHEDVSSEGITDVFICRKFLPTYQKFLHWIALPKIKLKDRLCSSTGNNMDKG